MFNADYLRIFASHKIRSAIERINYVHSLNHPFPESLVALSRVKNHLEDLIRKIELTSVPSAITSAYCKVALNNLEELIPLIGFLERATDVSGPVEFYGPFSRLTKRVLGDEASLVLSSSWRYTPYTIISETPVNGLGRFVFVGFSVSESDNSLLTPLAGHELGHNVWEKFEIGSKIKSNIAEKLNKQIRTTHKSEFLRLFQVPEDRINDLVTQSLWAPASVWTEKQLQECFCDLLGLYIFGPSYIWAFVYYQAPGIGGRSTNYPTLHDRYSYLTSKAANQGWDISALPSVNIFDTSARSTEGLDSANQSLLLDLADKARTELVDTVSDFAFCHVNDAGMLFNPAQSVSTVEVLRSGLPASNVSALSSITDAAWLLMRSCMNGDDFLDTRFKLHEKQQALNELILKSFEIMEIENVLKA